MPVIRDQRQFGGVGPVGVVRMNTGGAEKYSRIAEATQQLTKVAVSESAKAAEKSAIEQAEALDTARITTIDPKTGKPEALSVVANLGFIGRTGAEAYERVVQERFQQSIENEIKQKAGELALKYENDPYSADKYEEQMVSYLQNMAKTSEVGGEATAYTNFILNSGTQYITATKLNMMQEQIRRERAKTAQSVVDNIANRQDLIRQTAMSIASMPFGPERDQAQSRLEALMEATVDSARDAESSQLLKSGASISTQEVNSTIYGEAYITNAMEGLDTVSASNLALAFKTGSPEDLPEDLRKIYDDATKYMYRTVKGVDGEDVKVLNYDALEGVARAASVKVQELANDFEVNLPLEKLISDAFVNESIDLAGQLGPLVFGSDVPISQMADLIDKKLDSAFGILENKYLDPQSGMTAAEFNNAKRDIRGALAQGLLVTAYDNYRGSPEEARMQISDAYNRKDTSKLTGKTKAAVDALIKTSVPVDDDARIEEFILDLQSNDARNSAKFKDQQRTSAYNGLANLETMVAEGHEGAYEKAISLAESEFFSPLQIASNKRSVNAKYASSFIGEVMRGYVVGQDGKNRKVNSSDLAMAAAYALEGVDRGLPVELKEAVDEALIYTDQETLSSSINRREVSLSKIEADLKASADRNNLITKITSDQIVNNPSNSDRDTVEDAVLRLAKSPNFFESSEMFDPSSPAAQFLFKSTMSGVLPSTLKTNLEHLASGNFRGSQEGAKNLITFYSQMSNQPRGNAIINAFNGLTAVQMSNLEAIAQVHSVTSDDPNAIAALMAANNRDNGFSTVRAKAFAEAVDQNGGISTKEFVALAVPDAALNKEAINTLAPLADYLFSSFDAETIKTKLNSFWERSFADTQGYIIDYGSRDGTRSRYALAKIIPDDETRDFFVEKVNRELRNFKVTMKPIGQDIPNRAFLMPMSVSDTGIIYMAVRKDGGLLVPIPNPNMDNMPFAFSTSEEDVRAFAQKRGVVSAMDSFTMDEIIEMRQNDQLEKNKDMMGGWMLGPKR
jgi:hypothetical protein